jgi:primosomal protein N' (replication factor Y) (superfamily II helicase)
MADQGTSSRNMHKKTEEFGAGDRVSVLLPLPLAGAYDYRVPDSWSARIVRPGNFVNVPLGKRYLIGVVQGAAAGDVASDRLKDIAGLVEVPAMTDDLRKLIDWIAAYTLSAPGAVLRMAMSVPGVFDPPKPRTGYHLAGPPPDRLTEARSRVMDVLIDGPPRSKSDLASAAGVGVGVVSGLVSAGTLEPVELTEPVPAQPDPETPGPELSGDQQVAAADLVSAVKAGKFQATLLDGVTGSGKTEVYFEAIAETLRRGQQALVLVPEIALTLQWLSRFEARFGVPPAEWHSDLRSSQRRRTWRAISEGQVPVVVGARSGLFLPFPDLGLIVVDEEHEASFKQEEGVIYHARDMAVVRAMQADIPVVLASATPSLETLANIDSGRYRELQLPERHGGASLPRIRAIDMRKHCPPTGKWLSKPLLEDLERNLAAGEQSMLFLNRRGYAPLTLCRTCGHRLECPHCAAWLVEHRRAGRLMCHHCGFASTLPETCPECETEANFAACGPGVERLAEEVAELFPDARMAVMASDTISSPSAAAELVRQMAEREIDILVGTQIVAKGHHFPWLTLVGVIDADLGLNGGDLRAAERTWQVLSQVAGRAGRAERPGRVMLQTYLPDHPVMQTLMAADRDSFVDQEKAARRQHGMPPYARLAGVIVSGENDREVAAMAQTLGRSAPRSNDVTVLGPAPAPLSILRGRYRHRLLLRARRGVDVQAVLRGWLAAVPRSNHVRIQIDVDPISFL